VVDEHRAEYPGGGFAQELRQSGGEVVVTGPVPHPELGHAGGGERGGAVDVLGDGGEEAVAGQLQGVARQEALFQRNDDAAPSPL
jgi:hypothetical protein